MRYFSSILLAILALFLGGLVMMQTYDGNLYRFFGAPPLGQDDRVYQFDPNEVGRIEILSHDGTQAVVEKIGGAWVVQKPWEDIADPLVAQAIINFASNLVIEDVIDRDEVDDLAEFGLSGSKIELQLYDKGGRPLCHFNLGRNTAWRSIVIDDDQGPELYGKTQKEKTSSFPTVIIWPAEREQRDYLYVCGDQANPAIRRVGIRSLFDDKLKSLRNHGVFYRPPAFAAEISLNDGTSELTLARSNPSKDTSWRVTKPYELAANPETVNALIGELSTLRAVAVHDESSETLAEPTPENLAQIIRVKFFLPDGSVSSPTTVYVYPPEKAGDLITSAIIGTGPNQKRPAILKLPVAALAKLPTNVNQLRSKTLTSLGVAQIDSLRIKDHEGRNLQLTLEFDPHERAKRWHATLSGYEGPANEEQVGVLFKALFGDEILSFSDDAATDLSLYGLDQPMRTIEVQLKDDSTLEFAIGQREQEHYYVRHLKSGRIAEISKEAHEALKKGQSAPELAPLLRAETPAPNQPADLSVLGITETKKITIGSGSDASTLEFGGGKRTHFFSSRIGTSRVAEVSPQILTKIAMTDYRWRAKRLWNIDPFEIKGLLIQRSGQPLLQLSYNFFSQNWKAKLDGRDVTASLNTNKANRLLEKLANIKTHRWLGPRAENAKFQLNDPNLSITVIVEEVNDAGISVALTPKELRISQVMPGAENRFFYGSLSTDPDFFLIEVASVKGLAIDLID
ncbi:MAG: DUF4340 domain-containing protein [Akkermansiaceae bacterium]